MDNAQLKKESAIREWRKVLDDISKRPQANAMDPESDRWQYYVKNAEYQNMTLYLLDKMGINTAGFFHEYLDPGTGSPGESFYDGYSSVAFMEALLKTINEFTVRVDEEKTLVMDFISRLKRNYKQKINLEYNEEKVKKATGGMPLNNNKERKVRLAKLFRKYTETKGRNPSEEEWKDLVSGIDGISNKCIEDVYGLMNIHVLSDEMESENGEPVDIFEVTRTEQDMHYNPEAIYLEQETKESYTRQMRDMESEFAILFSGTTKVRKREIYRAFYTRDILQSLKLTNHIEGKEDILQEEKYKKGWYRYTKTPAGNQDIYEILSWNDNFYMDTVFVNAYLREAVEEKPYDTKRLEGIYGNLLKTGFRFTDEMIGKVLGETKQDISRSAIRYRQKRSAIHEYLEKNGEMELS